jgi:SsrA-binding protein
MPEEDIKLIAANKKAYHDFFIEEKLEAGISLTGTEVKSLRDGRANLKDSYALVKGGEMFILGLHIPPYSHGNIMNVDPDRVRKLLLHKPEIKKLTGLLARQGYTLVPLRVYFRRGLVKVELGLAKGKKHHDVRDAIKEREAKRDIERAVKGRAREKA